MTDHDFTNLDLVAIEPSHQKYIGITWQVNNFCNYQCKYCNPGNWAGHKYDDDPDMSDIEVIKHNLKTVIDHYQSQGYQAFKFFFSGGEPTVWNHLLPLIEWLNEVIDEPHMGINTNLSRGTSWWEKHHTKFHDVVASFHIDFADQERYVKNLILLQDKVNYLCSRMMMQEDRFQEVIDFGHMVMNTLDNYNLEWVPLFDDISVNVGPWEYSEQWMKDFFLENTFETQNKLPKAPGTKWKMASKEVYSDGSERALNGNRVVAERRNFFQGWSCNVGEALFINSRGDITAASCGQGPKIGNIYQDIDLSASTITCMKSQCTCGTDILITKHRPESDVIIARQQS